MLSNRIKTDKDFELNIKSRRDLLDSLCDQIVTVIGVAVMYGFDIENALKEVSKSNWSKFENGVPIFGEHGKIIKGKGYFRPKLGAYVGADPTYDDMPPKCA